MPKLRFLKNILAFLVVLLVAPQACRADSVFWMVPSAYISLPVLFLGIILVENYFLKKFFFLSEKQSLFYVFIANLVTTIAGFFFLFLFTSIIKDFNIASPSPSLSIFLFEFTASVILEGLVLIFFLKEFKKSIKASIAMNFFSYLFIIVLIYLQELSLLILVLVIFISFFKLTDFYQGRYKTLVMVVVFILAAGASYLVVDAEQHEHDKLVAEYVKSNRRVAQDATIKSYMDQLKIFAETYRYTSATSTFYPYGSYAGFTTGSSTDYTVLTGKIIDINDGVKVVASSTDSAYCIRSDLLIPPPTTDWCIDSTGFRGSVTSTQCTETDITCGQDN